MSKLQKILFASLIIAMVVLMFIFWGSLFSGIMAFCLIMSLSGYLYNRFLNADPTSDFLEDNNG